MASDAPALDPLSGYELDLAAPALNGAYFSIMEGELELKPFTDPAAAFRTEVVMPWADSVNALNLLHANLMRAKAGLDEAFGTRDLAIPPDELYAFAREIDDLPERVAKARDDKLAQFNAIFSPLLGTIIRVAGNDVRWQGKFQGFQTGNHVNGPEWYIATSMYLQGYKAEDGSSHYGTQVKLTADIKYSIL